MLGIDIIEGERIEKNLQNPSFLQKILTDQEIKYVNQFIDKTSHIAGFFCAKEAVMKALEECQNIAFKDIEVLHKDNGKPYVKLFGKALEVYEIKNCKSIEVSISQTKTVATAICIIN